MCVLILCRARAPGQPLLVAANRDEDPDRPASPPGLQVIGDRRLLCPLDRRRGGTWIGVNDAGIVAAVTNVAGHEAEPGARSRGHVTLEALAASDIDTAIERALAYCAQGPVGPFRLVVADRDRSVYLEYVGGQRRRRFIDDPILILTNRHPPGVVQIPGLSSWWLEDDAGSATDVEARLDRLVVTLATATGLHMGTGERFPVCIETGNPRTVSSTLIALPMELRHLRLRYCPGNPRLVAFRDYSGLSQRLLG